MRRRTWRRRCENPRLGRWWRWRHRLRHSVWSGRSFHWRPDGGTNVECHIPTYACGNAAHNVFFAPNVRPRSHNVQVVNWLRVLLLDGEPRVSPHVYREGAILLRYPAELKPLTQNLLSLQRALVPVPSRGTTWVIVT